MMKIKQFWSTENMNNAMEEALLWINNEKPNIISITTHNSNLRCLHPEVLKCFVSVWYHGKEPTK